MFPRRGGRGLLLPKMFHRVVYPPRRGNVVETPETFPRRVLPEREHAAPRTAKHPLSHCRPWQRIALGFSLGGVYSVQKNDAQVQRVKEGTSPICRPWQRDVETICVFDVFDGNVSPSWA